MTIKITTKRRNWISINGKSVKNATPTVAKDVLGVNNTLFIETAVERVMSDIWENVTRVYFLNEETGHIESRWYDDSDEYKVELTFDADRKNVIKSVGVRSYNRHYANALRDAQYEAANVAVKGRVVRVNRGRKVAKGTEGKVFFVKEGQYGVQLGLALDDETETRTSANGKTYEAHKNVVWVAASNCDVVNPESYVNLEEVAASAQSRTNADIRDLNTRFDRWDKSYMKQRFTQAA